MKKFLKESFLTIVVTTIFFACLFAFLWVLNCDFNKYREDVINELCNNNNGNYDFCQIKEVIYTERKKEIRNDTKNI